jgi:6-phosphogluconolactonase
VTGLEVEIHADAATLAAAAARRVAAALCDAVDRRGSATFAISGGTSPHPFFAELARLPVPWARVTVFQVDERIAPDGHPERNATLQKDAFAAVLAEHPARFQWMPVTAEDLAAAAMQYGAAVRAAAGAPAALDVVHLGLGVDGHTASLFPGERLDQARDVAVTAAHAGRRRMTMTLPLLNGADLVVFLVVGADKRAALAALRRRDPDCVATGVQARRIVVLADAAAGA